MLTGMKLNVESLEILKWKKKGTFFVCFADDSKTLVTVYAKHLKSPTKRSSWFLSENGMVHRFWSYRLWDIGVRNIKKLLS